MSGRSRFRAPASPMYAANFVSGFSRIVQVLKTTTSAASWLAASPSPSSSSMPLMRTLSCAFIWQPKVVTWYRLTRRRVATTATLVRRAGDFLAGGDGDEAAVVSRAGCGSYLALDAQDARVDRDHGLERHGH